MTIKLKQLANAIDFVDRCCAKSGHPGMPMGMADVASVLFKYHLRFNPKILDGLIEIDLFCQQDMVRCFYSLLYLTGYKSVSLNDIRILTTRLCCAGGSTKNSGIETTTGPLGQGLGNSVGIAIGEEISEKNLDLKLLITKLMLLPATVI